MAVLALQGDPDIFERREVREYSRNLERTNQAKARHVGWRHRRNILSLIENLSGGRLQELSQQVEARGLPGAVRPDQRMNTAATDLKADVTNGKETREFLGQSAGFENELIGQSNSPVGPAALSIAQSQFC